MTSFWGSPAQFFDLSEYEHKAVFAGCQSVWEVLERLEPYILSQQLGTISATLEPGVFLVNPELIVIGEGTVVESGAYIRGPCIIGKNCQIRHTAYLRGNILIGDRCVVGHTTELKHSIFLNRAKAGHFAFVGDSVLGNDVNLGAGVKCANLRLDGQSVTIHHQKERIATKLRKCGAFVGDGCQLGCNSVLNPGTLMGKRAQCFPCMNIGGVIAEEEIVRARRRPA